MATSRVDKMGGRKGAAAWIDHLRYHETSRQLLGLILLLVCGWFAVPAGGWRIAIGFVIAAVGQGWRIYAAGAIHKNRRLATSGAYSLVRHPLYLGNFLILGGFTVAAGDSFVAIAVLFFFLFYYPAAIRYEDHKLEGIFGDEWRDWSRSIPAMFPTGLDWRPDGESRWSAKQSLLRNGELFYTVFEVAAAVLLWYRAGS